MTEEEMELVRIKRDSPSISTSRPNSTLASLGLQRINHQNKILARDDQILKSKVLIAEDEENFRGLMKEIFDICLGVECVAASDAKSTLSLIERDSAIGVVMLDFAFDYSGLGIEFKDTDDAHDWLIRKILSLKPHVKIIVSTGFGSKENFKRSIQAGAFDYFLRPFLIEDIVQSMKNALNELQKETHSKTLNQYDSIS